MNSRIREISEIDNLLIPNLDSFIVRFEMFFVLTLPTLPGLTFGKGSLTSMDPIM